MELSTIDAALTRILAERKKGEAELAAKTQAVQAHEKKVAAMRKTRDERDLRWQKEEAEVKGERDKLVDRRKALASHTSYKIQQAAEREIEYTSNQLGLRETKILSARAELEELGVALAKLEEEYAALEAQRSAFEQEMKETLTNLESRQAEYEGSRHALVKDVDAAVLKSYDRVREKFPLNPLVPLKQETCSGCYMRVGPQSAVLIARGEIVRCAGCGRILYLEPTPEEAAG
jgi:uncharacterized protein